MVEILVLFLRLGITSFGGPAAHIALMEEEFVHRRQWLSREKFLDLIALTNLIPGPNSTEMAIHIGYLRAGWWGFLLAGISFILPAFILVLLIAAFYVRYAQLPQSQDFLLGAKAAVLAIILQTFWRFLKNVFKVQNGREFLQKTYWAKKQTLIIAFIFLTSLYLTEKGTTELMTLFTCGLISLFLLNRPSWAKQELGSLFLIFLKIGSILFGSGYVLLSFLQTEFVQQRHWLTDLQVLDSILVGQFTPGPVFTSATFVGFLLEGVPGACVATAGIFLPAFVFVALSIPLYQKLSSSRSFRTLLDGVVTGSLGLLLFTVGTMSKDLFQTPLTLVLFLFTLVLILRTKIPSPVLILLCGCISFLGSKI